MYKYIYIYIYICIQINIYIYVYVYILSDVSIFTHEPSKGLSPTSGYSTGSQLHLKTSPVKTDGAGCQALPRDPATAEYTGCVNRTSSAVCFIVFRSIPGGGCGMRSSSSHLLYLQTKPTGTALLLNLLILSDHFRPHFSISSILPSHHRSFRTFIPP